MALNGVSTARYKLAMTSAGANGTRMHPGNIDGAGSSYMQDNVSLLASPEHQVP